MKRVFFEKDPKFDYLFVIVHPTSNEQVYSVNNFTDEMGQEYVYTLVGERKTLTDDKLAKIVNCLSNGKYKNYNGTNDVDSARECMESIIDSRTLNKEEDIYIYYRQK